VIIFSANPGQVLSTIDVELPRPRWSNDETVKAGPQFIKYRKDI